MLCSGLAKLCSGWALATSVGVVLLRRTSAVSAPLQWTMMLCGLNCGELTKVAAMVWMC